MRNLLSTFQNVSFSRDFIFWDEARAGVGGPLRVETGRRLKPLGMMTVHRMERKAGRKVKGACALNGWGHLGAGGNMWVCIHVCIHVCVYMYTCMSICVCVCMYVPMCMCDEGW